MKWAKTLLCAECVDLFNFLKWFITEHGLYIALFLILIAYLIRENRKKDEELLRAKDDEIQRLSSFKKTFIKSNSRQIWR